MKILSILSILLLSLSVSQAQTDIRGNCSADRTYCAFFSPDDLPIAAVREYLKSAKVSIRIATYNANVTDFIDILNKQAEAGVKIEFLVDYKLSWKSNKVWNSLSEHENLIRYRVPVLRGGNPQMHNKVIIIDGKTILMGSANWTYSGLMANYENVLAITRPSVVKKFNDELDELREVSKKACELFSNKNCQSGGADWDSKFHEFATSGKVPENAILWTSSNCSTLTKGWGLVNNKSQFKEEEIKFCFKDGRWLELANFAAQNERYIDGQKVSDNLEKFLEEDAQEGQKDRVYFAPEDNIEKVLLDQLSKALITPEESFVYISTNFITNKKFAKKVVELFENGVRVKLFFDRGRYEDDNFQHAISILKPLGFTNGTDRSDIDLLTIFDNKITGPYGSNHNKMAIMSTPREGLALINGSANWSNSAVRRNDENLLVIKDDQLVAIYAKEIISQLYVYRYSQNIKSPGFQDDLAYLESKIPCLGNIVGTSSHCEGWAPKKRATAVLSVKDVPASAETQRVWAWVPQLNNNNGGAVELFTHRTFEGKWVSSVSLPPNWRFSFKFFKTSIETDPNSVGLTGASWEYEGMGNDRWLSLPALSLEKVGDVYTWGKL
ncbi:MAG: hypothetical protein HOE90_22130 [Bacteriovoracaceae bacterium]|nr:hypothetical protein [Bacteriovoracaceae bacterium]